MSASAASPMGSCRKPTSCSRSATTARSCRSRGSSSDICSPAPFMPARASSTGTLPTAPDRVLAKRPVQRPAAPALAVGYARAAWLTPEGEIERLDPVEAGRRARKTPPILCHGRAIARRLGVDAFAALDLLELYAFVRPARSLVPTARGLAIALSLPAPHSLEDEALTLMRATDALLAELAATGDGEAKSVAQQMAAAGWLWGAAVLAALAQVPIRSEE